MDALDVAKVCLRRWYVCVPIIALAVLAGLQLTSGRVPTYSATGSFALLYTHADEIGPNEKDPRVANPLVNGGTDLLTATLLADMTSAKSQQELAQPGVQGSPPQGVDQGQDATLGGAFAVDHPRNSRTITVTAFSADPNAARAMVLAVLESVPARLTRIQGEFDAPPKSQYTSFVTGAPQLAQFPPQSRMKALVALAGVGGLAGAGLSLVVDRLLVRRRLRAPAPRRSRRDSPDDDGNDPQLVADLLAEERLR